MRARAQLIQIEPRGFAPNTPVLSCPEVDTILHGSLTRPFNDPSTYAAEEQDYPACHSRLVSSGINPASYTYDDTADDVVDLMAVLGLRQADLLAVDQLSHIVYGVLAKIPQAIRTITLDNPEPPGSGALADPVADLAGAFERYASLCNADKHCASQFPNLGGLYAEEERRYGSVPVVAQTGQTVQMTSNVPVLLDGGRAAQVLYFALDVSDVDNDFLPLIAAGIAQPPLGLTATLSYNYIFGVSPEPDWGALATWDCSYDLQTRLASGSAVSDTELPAFDGVAVNQSLLDKICSSWKVPTLRSSYFDGVSSLVPTLIVRGSLSPSGNNDWPAQVQKSLQSATIGIFPTIAEGAVANAPPCLNTLRRQFLAMPTSHLNMAACTAQSPPINFVDTP